jgi:hypothetical protein
MGLATWLKECLTSSGVMRKQQISCCTIDLVFHQLVDGDDAFESECSKYANVQYMIMRMASEQARLPKTWSRNGIIIGQGQQQAAENG